MKRLLLFYLLIFLITGSTKALAYDFAGFSKRTLKLNDKEALNAALKKERLKFNETGDEYYLYNSKFIEYCIATKIENNKNKALNSLSWIIENNNIPDSTQISWIFYHLGTNLAGLNAHELSNEYLEKSYSFITDKNIDVIKWLIYSQMGNNYYRIDDYQKALEKFELSYQVLGTLPCIQKASSLNNIALCYNELNEFIIAKQRFSHALDIIEATEEKTDDLCTFKVIVEGNLGSVFRKLNENKKAVKYLLAEVNYYLEQDQRELLNSPTIELLSIYTRSNDIKGMTFCVSILTKLSKQYTVNSGYPLSTEALTSYFIRIKNNTLAIHYSNLLKEQMYSYNSHISKQTNDLYNILYRNKIEFFKNEKYKNELIVERTLYEKNQNYYIIAVIISILVLLYIIGIITYRNRKINYSKDIFINKQQKEIEQKKNTILQSELSTQQEKITSYALNLSIIKETEKVFLKKVKEFKKNDTIDKDTVLSEFQISFSNLLNVDDRFKNWNTETEKYLADFKSKLLKKHPDLTKNELTYCCYFKLKLSSKEIGSIVNKSDVAIRVAKNKIKNKMVLKDNYSLNDYLNSF